jgi:hypothetical protein
MIQWAVILRSSCVTVEDTTHVVQLEMERVLSSHWLWADKIGCNCNRSANKSNHPIQNSLLLVTQTPHTWQYTIKITYLKIRALGAGFDSRHVNTFLLSTALRPTLGSIQPPIKWVPGVRWPVRETDSSPASSAAVKKGETVPPLLHMSLWYSA